MAQRDNRVLVKLRSTESSHTYTTTKNRSNSPQRLEVRKFDPTVRRHVLYQETR